MKRHETILKYIGDGEYTADMEENAEGGWVLADEAQRLLTEARARIAELVSEAESQRKRANEAEARARPALTEEDRTVLAGLHTDLDDELACVPDDSTRGRWLARHIAVLDRLLAAPAPSHQTLLTALSSPDVRSGLSHVETGPDRDGKVRRYRVFGDALECSWRRVESDRFGGWEPVELSLRDLDATAVVATADGGDRG